MSTLLLLTNALQPSVEVLPGLCLLGHQVRILPAEGSALLEAPESDLLLVDGRQDLAGARDLCRLIRTTGTDVPVLLVVTEGGLSVVSLADLPPEASRIVDLIDSGGPFDEDRDGVTFRNDEELLPDRPSGYYREYTVPTPGSDDRGARRIVAGEDGELYYTGDHYRSFSRIAT